MIKFKFWPRTLVVQLIAVTAAAVVLSNIGVAFWFEHSNAQQNQNFLNDRMLDRAAAVATTLSAIPPQSRPVVMRTMGSPIWKFTQFTGTPRNNQPMTREEAALAKRLVENLPENHPNRASTAVHLNVPLDRLDPSQRPRRVPPGSAAAQAVVPVSDHILLSAVFVRPPPDWPLEIMVATAVAILVASAAAAIMARRVARPLSELTAAASVVAGGGTAPHVDEIGPDDVRNAAIAFNKMTEQVAKTLESQRHLLSAVGHDLRTPITAMRINLEFVEDGELRERLLGNLDELQTLTEQVLASARGTGGEAKRSVDLSALVESLVADLDDMGEPVTWHNHSVPAPVSCRPNEIRRAVRNLIQNAVAYGSRADVQITEGPSGYEIVVEDDGPGISEDDRQRVFEPFVRLESSRNTATGGTGLGLTLVKAIAEGHGGGISLENRETGGLRARMRMPRWTANA